jgi:hypothetical protein
MRKVVRDAGLTLPIGRANADESEGFIAMPHASLEHASLEHASFEHASFENVFAPKNIRRIRQSQQ